MANVQKEAKEHAGEIVSRVRQHQSSWDEAFRVALAKHHFTRWMATRRPEELEEEVARQVNAEFKLLGDDALSVTWYEEQAEARRNDLIETQAECVREIDLARNSLESAREKAKSAKATITESSTLLRETARDLKSPYVFELPNEPNRQRELPMADGEEWRAVKLSDVLRGDPKLKAVALEKLGDINLGKYCDEVRAFGMGDKPKKLTRKQWDRVEEAVQAWHAEQKDAEEDEDGDGGGM